MRKKEIKNLTELKKISFELAKKLKRPQLVLLEGPLAAGKTQMAKYMAEALGFAKDLTGSPAFSLINVYKKQEGDFIYHIDLFRLESLKDIESAGFWDIFYEPGVALIEWPHLVRKKLPALWNRLDIELSFARSPEGRILKWEWIRPAKAPRGACVS